MDFLKNLSAMQKNVLKFGGAFLLGVIMVVGFSGQTGTSPFVQMKNDVMEQGYSSDAGYYGEVMLSERNISGGLMPPMDPTYTPGADTEDYEVKNYSISFESRNKAKECVAIRDLLKRDDVVFENTNEYDSGCSYSFKVKKESVEAVLYLLDSLNPKEVNENAYTIKREVTDYTSEIEILEKKLAAITTTLTESLATYDSLIARATAQGNVSSLAQLTDSKLNLLERLTMSQIEINAQLERINRSKAEALDRLAYTQFYVSVYENKFINGKEIGNSWTAAVQKLFRDMNNFAQEVSLGFVALLFMIVKYALYGVVILFVVRFGFNFAKKVWQDGASR
ncbi:MAG TPA: hypothetical protein PKA42_00780 [Candidatus Paceibacterota bacterium]|nr:hypothetical protein [Candidatus Paceibacterota bacterium]HMO82677.1 hypothetical protein [Candidatus Paceibacterota bacterium]